MFDAKEWKYLKPISEAERISDFLEKLRTIAFRVNNDDCIYLVKQKGWIAVPVESADHFSESEETRLLSIVQNNGNEQLIAFLFEKIKDFPLVSVVPPTAEGIAELNWEFSHFWLALFAEESDWVIIGTKNNYFLVAGKPDLVRDFLGCEIEEAFSELYEYLSDYLDPSDPLGEYLLSVHHDLQAIYPQLEPGSILCVGESKVFADSDFSPTSQ